MFTRRVNIGKDGRYKIYHRLDTKLVLITVKFRFWTTISCKAYQKQRDDESTDVVKNDGREMDLLYYVDILEK